MTRLWSQRSLINLTHRLRRSLSRCDSGTSGSDSHLDCHSIPSVSLRYPKGECKDLSRCDSCLPFGFCFAMIEVFVLSKITSPNLAIFLRNALRGLTILQSLRASVSPAGSGTSRENNTQLFSNTLGFASLLYTREPYPRFRCATPTVLKTNIYHKATFNDNNLSKTILDIEVWLN